MSYVLGFIVADGCIGVKRLRKDGTKQFCLSITSKDISLLKNIRKVMSAGQSIILKQSGTKKGACYHLQIGYQEICNDLINLGIYPRKTYNLNPIKVPYKYFPDFVRGFFDGDGTVYIYKVNGVPQIKVGFISTSLSFLTELNKQLCRSLDIPIKSIHKTTDGRVEKGMTQFTTHFYIDDCKRLYKFMYKNASIFLDRKYKIFKKWENMKSKNRRHYIKKNYPSKIGWQLNQKVLA